MTLCALVVGHKPLVPFVYVASTSVLCTCSFNGLSGVFDPVFSSGSSLTILYLWVLYYINLKLGEDSFGDRAGTFPRVDHATPFNQQG